MPHQRNYVYWDGTPARGSLKHWWRFVYDDSNRLVHAYRGIMLLLTAAMVAVGVVAVAVAIVTGQMNSAYAPGTPHIPAPHWKGHVNLGTTFNPPPTANWPSPLP